MFAFPIQSCVMSSGGASVETEHVGGAITSLAGFDFPPVANYFDSTDLLRYQPGRTLIVIFDDVTGSQAGNMMLGCGANSAPGVVDASRNGWVLAATGGGPYWSVFGQGDGTHCGLGPTAKLRGIQYTAMTWRASDNHIIFASNGALGNSGTGDYGQAATSGGAFDGTCRTRLGYYLPNGGFTGFGGGILAIALIDRELSTSELQQYTGYGDESRVRLLPVVTSDSDALVIWEADVDWDGSSATHTSRGSTPITFTKVGSPVLTDMSEVRVVATNNNVLDSGPKVAATGFNFREEFSRMQFVSDATRIAVDTYGNNGTVAFGVYVNGAYNAAPSTGVGDVQMSKDVFFSAGSKTINVHSGQQAGGNPPNGNTGNYIAGIRIPSASTRTFTQRASSAPANRLVIIGDSITSGYNCTLPQQDAFRQLLRYSLTSASVTSIGWSGQRFDYLTDGTAFDDFVARLAFCCNGTGRNVVLWETVTNDYAAGVETPTAHATRLDTAISALEAAVPGVESIIWGAFQRVAPANENAVNGYTLGAWRTARSGVAALNPSQRTYVAGNTVVSDVNMDGTGFHLTTAGDAQVAAYLNTLLAFT